MVNFEAFCQIISSNINLFFLKSGICKFIQAELNTDCSKIPLEKVKSLLDFSITFQECLDMQEVCSSFSIPPHPLYII